jgi:gliding motility-associated lipoprotein GldH
MRYGLLRFLLNIAQKLIPLMHKLYYSLFLLFTLALTSCGPDYIVNQSYEISNSTWTYGDTLNFEIEVKDSLKIYNLFLDIEHSTDFYFHNMYVQIHTAFPSGKRISEQVSIELANKAGTWFGNCNEDWCTISIPIQSGAYFDAIGKHTITLEQYTRKDSLPGIRSIAFKVEDTGQSR